MDSLRVLGTAGSLRKGSYNQLLLHAAREGAPEGIEVHEFILKDLPLYHPDLESTGEPDAVKAWKDAIVRHDALLIATPEYGYGVPAVLKSALEWASQPHKHSVLEGKPVALMGASTDPVGTLRAQLQLRQMLLYSGCPIVAAPEVLVPRAQTRFSEGYLSDEAPRGNIRGLLEALRQLVLHLRA